MTKHKPQNLIFPEEIPDQVLSDFLTLRKARRAPLTQTALNGIAREAEKAGVSLTVALEICCMFGWQGFRADWIKLRVNNETNKPIGKPSLAERATNARKETERRITEREAHGEFMGENDAHLPIQVVVGNGSGGGNR